METCPFPGWVCHEQVCHSLLSGHSQSSANGFSSSKKLWSDSEDGHVMLGRGLGPWPAPRRQDQVWHRQSWLGGRRYSTGTWELEGANQSQGLTSLLLLIGSPASSPATRQHRPPGPVHRGSEGPWRLSLSCPLFCQPPLRAAGTHGMGTNSPIVWGS